MQAKGSKKVNSGAPLINSPARSDAAPLYEGTDAAPTDDEGAPGFFERTFRSERQQTVQMQELDSSGQGTGMVRFQDRDDAEAIGREVGSRWQRFWAKELTIEDIVWGGIGAYLAPGAVGLEAKFLLGLMASEGEVWAFIATCIGLFGFGVVENWYKGNRRGINAGITFDINTTIAIKLELQRYLIHLEREGRAIETRRALELVQPLKPSDLTDEVDTTLKDMLHFKDNAHGRYYVSRASKVAYYSIATVSSLLTGIGLGFGFVQYPLLTPDGLGPPYFHVPKPLFYIAMVIGLFMFIIKTVRAFSMHQQNFHTERENMQTLTNLVQETGELRLECLSVAQANNELIVQEHGSNGVMAMSTYNPEDAHNNADYRAERHKISGSVPTMATAVTGQAGETPMSGVAASRPTYFHASGRRARGLGGNLDASFLEQPSSFQNN